MLSLLRHARSARLKSHPLAAAHPLPFLPHAPQVRFLRIHGPQRKVIVYGMTCAAVDHLAAILPRLPQLRGRVVLRALHGKMKQAARERELEAFRAMPAGAWVGGCNEVQC